MKIARQVSGFRRFWLALERSTVQVRDIREGRIVLSYQMEEGDGLVLHHEENRVDGLGDWWRAAAARSWRRGARRSGA